MGIKAYSGIRLTEKDFRQVLHGLEKVSQRILEDATRRMARLVANLAVTDIDRRALGIAPILEEHMKRVNGWSDRQLAEAIERAYEVWEQRCEWNWTVDLSWLEESGYVYV